MTEVANSWSDIIEAFNDFKFKGRKCYVTKAFQYIQGIPQPTHTPLE